MVKHRDGDDDGDENGDVDGDGSLGMEMRWNKIKWWQDSNDML